MVRLASCIMILCLLLSSCGGTSSPVPISSLPPDDTTSGLDMPLAYAPSKGNLCKYQSVYYYNTMRWIMYYDEQSQTSGKLCAKPDCTHDEITCNAYIPGFGRLQIYDEMLYFLGSMGDLYQMDLSGNQREFVMSIRMLNGANGTWVIHRGYVYTSLFETNVKDGEPFEHFSLCRYQLGTSEPKEMIFEKDFEQLIADDWAIHGDSLFLSLNKSIWNYRELYHFDLKTLESSQLISGSYSGTVSNFQLTEEGITFAEKDKERVRITQYDFATGEFKKQQEWDDATGYFPGLSADQSLILFYNQFTPKDGDHRIEYRIRETQGKGQEVSSGSIEEYTQLVQFYGSDETGFFLEKQCYTDIETVYELWRILYDTGEAELLIQLVRENPNP